MRPLCDRRAVDRVSVTVLATDPISQQGVEACLRPRQEVRVLTEQESADVLLVVVDEMDDVALRLLRSLARRPESTVVLVPTRIDDGGLVKAVEAGVVGVVRRCDGTADQLAEVIQAAANGEGRLPGDLLGRLLVQVGRLQRQVLAPRGLSFAGLAQREIEVLRLVADGYDTAEIAGRLAYSERTVKNVLHDVTSRLQLRNRSQAVAYALREGLI